MRGREEIHCVRGIRPEKIDAHSYVGYVTRTSYSGELRVTVVSRAGNQRRSNLLEGYERVRDSSVNTEDPSSNDGRERKTVEDVIEVTPQLKA